MTFKYINCPESPLHGIRVEIVDAVGYDVMTDEVSGEFCVVKAAEGEWCDPEHGDQFSVSRSACVDEKPEIDSFHALCLESARQAISETHAKMMSYATPEAHRFVAARQDWMWRKKYLLEMCRSYAEQMSS